MLILGIDPSLCHTGLAILDTESQKIIYTRTIHTNPKESIQARLHHLFGHIRQLMQSTPIEQVAIETQYMGKYSTALKVAMAYAACLIACEVNGVNIAHYTPSCVKKNASGIGTADKTIIINAMEILYGMSGINSHVADAIALAHVHQQFI